MTELVTLAVMQALRGRLPRDRPPLGVGRVGRVRVLRQPLPLLLGLRLHLLCTVHGLPVGFALTGAKADERQSLLGILDEDPDLTNGRAGQTLIGDRNYFGRDFETALSAAGLVLLRPARKGESERGGARFFKPLRQVIESINATFKGQLDLERHGGHTPAGVIVRSYNASSPWPPRSGTTTALACPVACPPTIHFRISSPVGQQ